MGDKQSKAFQLTFNGFLKVDFRGSRVTSDGGLILIRELDDRLGLPRRIKSWSLTSFQQRLMKTGGHLVKHAWYYWLLLAEGRRNRRLFGDMLLHRIWALPLPLPSGQR